MTLLAEIALVALAAVGATVCVAWLPRSRADPRAPSVRRLLAVPDQLRAAERVISNASASPVHVHAYLRPALAEITDQRLAARGCSLERLPDPDSRRLLGDELWEIVRPGRPFPKERSGPGLGLPELDAILSRLEKL